MFEKMINAYLETGSKRSMVTAVDWPGWCRGARSDKEAIQALVDYGKRYKRALYGLHIAFIAPRDVDEVHIVQHLTGDANTDYGVPGKLPSLDDTPVDDAELSRLQSIVRACIRAFDRAVAGARGKVLSKGPRGGGRDLDEIVQHVYEGQRVYLSRCSIKLSAPEAANPDILWPAVLDALAASAHGLLPTAGPRGGAMWKPRYFTHRAAWHILDHAWEIEDRVG